MNDSTLRVINSKTTLLIVVSLAIGCSGSSLPSKDYDPQAITSSLLLSFDANGDGKLDEGELKDCPSLYSALVRVDTNQDGSVDASEITSRIEAYADMSQFIIAEVVINQKKTPVSGAKITMTLSEFMNNIMTTKFITTTNAAGAGVPQSSPEKLLGFPPGFYDVEVEYEGKSWNFGVEMADDVPDVSRVVFDLSE